MPPAPDEHLLATWPLFGLRLDCGKVTLRPVRESDLTLLAAMQPDDYEHDPGAQLFQGLDRDQQRARLSHQDYWRSMGTWSPESWALAFVVEHDDSVVGVQTLEAERFLAVHTVDSGSWLIRSVRGRGLGVAMRSAVLGLAFDHLGAHAAITSAHCDNAASLGVSRRVGYRDNGVSLNASPNGLTELQHMRLTREEWQSTERRDDLRVTGLEPCLPWFGLPRPPTS